MGLSPDRSIRVLTAPEHATEDLLDHGSAGFRGPAIPPGHVTIWPHKHGTATTHLVQPCPLVVLDDPRNERYAKS